MRATRTALASFACGVALGLTACGDRYQDNPGRAEHPETPTDPTEPDAGQVPAAVACDLEPESCGASLVGSWRVLDCPLELTGEVNLLGFGLGCATARVTSGSLEVSGTWSLAADGEISDDTFTTGEQVFEVPESCFSVGIVVTCERLGTVFGDAFGYATLACLDAETGGCTCRGRFEQRGGLATLSRTPLVMGSYSVEDTTLTLVDAANQTSYEHCATQDALILNTTTASDVGLAQGPMVLWRLP